MRKYEPKEGEDIKETARNIVKLAVETGDLVETMFCGIRLTVTPQSDPVEIERLYDFERYMLIE